MPLDFGRLASNLSGQVPIEPRKIFSTLSRSEKFKRPTDEQADVLDGWFEARQRRDLTIKMNTGSGKTLVGLLLLQSSLNEGCGPAAYICPDSYLVEQVTAEAKELGITTTSDERSLLSGLRSTHGRHIAS
jgi:replicative superfamily II helicase